MRRRPEEVESQAEPVPPSTGTPEIRIEPQLSTTWRKRPASNVVPVHRVLCLFGGPKGRPDGVEAICKALNAEAVIIDWVNAPEEDLLDDVFFAQMVASVERGHYSAALIASPCETFSVARQRLPGETSGPRALRGPRKPDLYGFADLNPDDKRACRNGTLLAVRSAQVATLFHSRSLPWILENPFPFDRTAPSLFELDEVWQLRQLEDVILVRTDQCMDGADCTKPTGLLGPRGLLENFGKVCNHPAQWWRYPDGEWVWASHAPLRRKGATGAPSARPVVAHEWHPHLSNQVDAYPTQDKKAYPGPFNKRLLHKLLGPTVEVSKASGKIPRTTCSVRKFPPMATAPEPRCPTDPDPDGVFQQGPLRPYSLKGTKGLSKREIREVENREAIGGMRNPAAAVKRIPKARSVGKVLFQILQALFVAHISEIAVLDQLGSESCKGFSAGFVESARAQCAQALGFEYKPFDGVEWSSLRPDFIEAYVAQTGDPEAHLASWVRNGCPLGIRQELEASGVFPKVDQRDKPAVEAEALQSNMAGFTNYASLEDWPDVAREQIQRLVDDKFVQEFSSAEEITRLLGEEPVLSKLALLSKQREDFSWKHRLIVDLLRSDVNSFICQGERIVLPRLGDAILDGLHLRRSSARGPVEIMVADFVDAFFMLPLSDDERKFVAFKAFDKFYLARVLMFGAKSSPTLWGRCAAFLARSAQSLFDETRVRLQLFVDDTFAQARGNKSERRMMFAIVLAWWSVLGAKIAWHKGAVGSDLAWIGARVRHEASLISVTVKEELLRAALDTTQAFLRGNVIRASKLRSLAGRLSFMAGIIPTLKPFLGELWAAIAESVVRDLVTSRSSTSRKKQKQLPDGTIWKRQVAHSLRWIEAFLLQTNCKLQRVFVVDRDSVTRWSIWTDASPWGVGAVLVKKSHGEFHILEWLATPLFQHELTWAGLSKGDPAGQALWEALALLVAIRAWRSMFGSATIAQLSVRSDSMAALGAARRFASPDPKVNLVMKELALVCAVDGFAISLVEHTPGAANKVPDVLSRRYEVDNWSLPSALVNVPERRCDPRTEHWWHTKRSPYKYRWASDGDPFPILVSQVPGCPSSRLVSQVPGCPRFQARDPFRWMPRLLVVGDPRGPLSFIGNKKSTSTTLLRVMRWRAAKRSPAFPFHYLPSVPLPLSLFLSLSLSLSLPLSLLSVLFVTTE